MTHQLMALCRPILAGVGFFVGVSACTDLSTGIGDPTGPDDPQFIEVLSVAGLHETLNSGSLRVAITIASDGAFAHEVEIGASGAADAEASIESTVTGFELQKNQTLLLTLAPGNVFVRVGDGTRLFGDHNDELDFGSFVVRLGKALSEGQEFTVRARGEVSQAPNGSDLLELVASQVDSGFGSDGIRLELNIDRNNLELNNAPPPDAWINVLGLHLELRVSTGETALERSSGDLGEGPREDVGDSHDEDFMGQVESVNLLESSFVTSEGIVVRVSHDTELWQAEGDHRLTSLEAVAEVLETGTPVFATGHGTVESSDPLVILAHHVTFESAAHGGEFMGQVESVNLEENSFVISGIVVRLNQHTEIGYDFQNDRLLSSLAAVAEALEAGQPVLAAVAGIVESRQPLVVMAQHVTFELEVTPRSLSVAVTPATLWPPNHEYVTISLSVSATDAWEARVASSDPDDANGKGDGSTTGDIRVTLSDGTELLSSNAEPSVHFDPTYETLELRAEHAGTGPGRTYTIVVTATDASGNSTTQTVTVTVLRSPLENDSPTADSGPDQTLEWEQGLTVTLNGSGSSDPDGDPLTYEWTDSDGDGVGTTAQVTVSLSGLGDHTFTLTVTDPSGATDSDDVTITAQYTTPPSTIEAPGFQPTGLAFDGTFLYLSEESGDRPIYRLDPTTGAVLGSSPLCPCDEFASPSDIVFDGAGRLLVSSMSGIVFEIDIAGTTVSNSFSLPFRGGAIAFDGTNLYIGNADGQEILVTDRSGTPIRTFLSGLRPAGMVFDPTTGNLWVISEMDKKISEITTQGDLIRQCDGPRESGPQGIGAVTLVGSKLYIAEASDYYFNPHTTIFIVDPKTLTCDTPN